MTCPTAPDKSEMHRNCVSDCSSGSGPMDQEAGPLSFCKGRPVVQWESASRPGLWLNRICKFCTGCEFLEGCPAQQPRKVLHYSLIRTGLIQKCVHAPIRTSYDVVLAHQRPSGQRSSCFMVYSWVCGSKLSRARGPYTVHVCTPLHAVFGTIGPIASTLNWTHNCGTKNRAFSKNTT